MFIDSFVRGQVEERLEISSLHRRKFYQHRSEVYRNGWMVGHCQPVAYLKLLNLASSNVQGVLAETIPRVQKNIDVVAVARYSLNSVSPSRCSGPGRGSPFIQGRSLRVILVHALCTKFVNSVRSSSSTLFQLIFDTKPNTYSRQRACLYQHRTLFSRYFPSICR